MTVDEVPRKCEVCHKNPIVGVACSSTGPVSFGYCEECLRSGREPYGALLASLIGRESMDDVAGWYQPIIQITLKAESKTEEELWEDVKAITEDYNRDAERAEQVNREARLEEKIFHG